MTVLDGKLISNKIKDELTEKVNEMIGKGHRAPHLAAILVGNDGPSTSYVNTKVNFCKEVGFKSSLFHLAEDTSENTLLSLVKVLNENDEIDGFIVQLPLPNHIDEQKVVLHIDPKKDVDGFHPINVGRLTLGMDTFLSATPAGILELMKRYRIPTEGKSCLVIGRSNIVGTPMSLLMSQKNNPGNCTVTLAHSKTKNIKSLALNSDIIIAAIGKPHFVTADMVKDGATVIDVGINRVPDETTKKGYRVLGDVDYENVAPKCSFISPVPGGVGLMTVCSLMLNTYKAYERRIAKMKGSN